MGIRQALGDNKRIGTIAVLVLFMVAAASVAYQVWSSGPQGPVVPSYFYTTDDGKTWFKAPATLVPPFDHDGKQAVRVWLYECSGKEFVAYLERFSDSARKVMAQAEDALKNAKKGDQAPSVIFEAAEARRSGREVKRPGDKDWVPAFSKEGAKITNVQCPPGMSGTPQPVTP
jgi:hypothetical protein